MAATAPVCDFGWQATDFELPATDGRNYRLADIGGPRGRLVMFLCNHCPYVLAVLPRLIEDARALIAEGIGVAAICSNDAGQVPDDGFPQMVRMAAERGFPFPYLHDETQAVARAWGAACTPDFFGFAADGGLQYRGRLDASGRAPAPPDAPRELLQAMRLIAATGRGPARQVPSIGCSIKWKAAGAPA